jgi:hypothetical protein
MLAKIKQFISFTFPSRARVTLLLAGIQWQTSQSAGLIRSWPVLVPVGWAFARLHGAVTSRAQCLSFGLLTLIRGAETLHKSRRDILQDAMSELRLRGRR